MDPPSCNKCGECCRQGGVCIFRGWAKQPMEFTGACDQLTKDGECSVMLTVIEQGNAHYLTQYGVVGICNFVELRKPDVL